VIALFFVAVLGGALNAVAGGGPFLTFPALLLARIPPIRANATASLALWPASVASAFAYRKDLTTPRRALVALLIASVLGAFIGVMTLLHTSDAAFLRLVPFLLLAATLLFTFGSAISARLLERATEAPFAGRRLVVGVAAQGLIAIYGGYFGAGMGILMLSMMSLVGMTNIHGMNALRNVLSVLINAVAVTVFVASGAIAWKPGVVMILGGIIGGYWGAAGARRIDPTWVKRFVIAVAWSMTAYFFARAR
jgi:uncharacterized membrane protein YfcA